MGGVLYVDDDATPGGDGLSWQTAHRFLQDALAHAADPNNGVTEIRLAQGMYKPDQGQGQTPGDRNATFQIPSGLAMRGGYAGLSGGDDPDARDWDKFESICSGDLLGNDPPQGTLPSQWTTTQFADNSRHVMSLDNGVNVILEGLFIQSGFRNQGVDDVGAGLYCNASTCEITHCTIRGNWGDFGGGAGIRNSSVLIRWCRILENRAFVGGGISGSSGTIIEDSLFQGNRIVGIGQGGGLSGASAVRRCEFKSNVAAQSGQGGGLASVTLVEQCLFYQNGADLYGAVGGLGTCKQSEFIENIAWGGGAVLRIGTYIDCTFRSNIATERGGVAFTLGSNPASAGAFIYCTFQNNVALNLSGGAFDCGSSFINCTFLGNDSWAEGGGAICARQHTTLVNCVLAGNKTLQQGGAIRVMPNRTLTLINTTIVNNTSQQGLGGIAVEGNAVVHNSIIWGNQGVQVTGNSTLEYSCIEGGWDGPGVGNISSNPYFIDALGPDGIAGTADDDLRLLSRSPCIDAGDRTILPPDTYDIDGDGDTTEPLPIDFEGNLRVVNDPAVANTGWPLGPPNAPMVDMGAYEHPAPFILGDVTHDGWVNVNDLLLVINSWGPCPKSLAACPADLNKSGIVDQLDLLIVIQNWG